MKELNKAFSDIIEYFRSFQGESPYVGMNSIFIRFKLCNLTKICHFCDTKEKMLNEPGFIIPFQSVISHMKQYYISCLTFTGGEPTLPKYRKQIIDFMQYLYENEPILLKRKFLIETNGFNLIEFINELPYNLKSCFMIVWSPKMFDDSFFQATLDIYSKLKDLDVNFIIKPVVNESSIPYIESLINHIEPFHRCNVYLMPQGTSNEELKKSSELASTLAQELCVNLSPRLHISYNLP